MTSFLTLSDTSNMGLSDGTDLLLDDGSPVVLTGFNIADKRRLPVWFLEPACPLLYDEQSYPICYDSSHLKTLITGASLPVIYGQLP